MFILATIAKLQNCNIAVLHKNFAKFGENPTIADKVIIDQTEEIIIMLK